MSPFLNNLNGTSKDKSSTIIQKIIDIHPMSFEWYLDKVDRENHMTLVFGPFIDITYC